MIRWSVQKGFITIPKSAKKHRIEENTKIFDWNLTEEDMQELVRDISRKKKLFLWLRNFLMA